MIIIREEMKLINDIFSTTDYVYCLFRNINNKLVRFQMFEDINLCMTRHWKCIEVLMQ